MLVLSRKIDESTLLGTDIKIKILGIEDDRVRIGIEAPRSVSVLREELVSQAADVNRESATYVKKFKLSDSSESKNENPDE